MVRFYKGLILHLQVFEALGFCFKCQILDYSDSSLIVGQPLDKEKTDARAKQASHPCSKG